MNFREFLENKEVIQEGQKDNIVGWGELQGDQRSQALVLLKKNKLIKTSLSDRDAHKFYFGIEKGKVVEVGVNSDMKEDEETLVLEGLTLDIVATFKSDGKAGPVTIRKDEQAEVYHLSNSYKDKGTLFTAKQWEEMKNAMKLYEKI